MKTFHLFVEWCKKHATETYHDNIPIVGEEQALIMAKNQLNWLVDTYSHNLHNWTTLLVY